MAGRRRPSPALVVALVALVGAWGGPAVAAGMFDSADIRDNSLRSRDVKDRSLQGRDIKGNTLTGRVVANLTGRDVQRDSLDGSDIAEELLREVPRAGAAGRADSAARADSADVLTGGSIRRVYAAQPAATGATTVLELGGLRLRARCSSTSVLGVTATPIGGIAFLRSSGTVRATNNATSPFFAKDDEVQPGQEFDVLPGGTDNVAGQLTFVGAAGDVVNVDFIGEQDIATSRGMACLFAGVATHGAP